MSVRVWVATPPATLTWWKGECKGVGGNPPATLTWWKGECDSYTDSETDSYGIGCYWFLKKSVQCTYTDSYSDADGYCPQFDTDIGTDKVFLK